MVVLVAAIHGQKRGGRNERGVSLRGERLGLGLDTKHYLVV